MTPPFTQVITIEAYGHTETYTIESLVAHFMANREATENNREWLAIQIAEWKRDKADMLALKEENEKLRREIKELKGEK